MKIFYDIHSRYTANGLESMLSYTPLSERDYGTLLCYATNAVGTQPEPCSFTVISAGLSCNLSSLASVLVSNKEQTQITNHPTKPMFCRLSAFTAFLCCCLRIINLSTCSPCSAFVSSCQYIYIVPTLHPAVYTVIVIYIWYALLLYNCQHNSVIE